MHTHKQQHTQQHTHTNNKGTRQKKKNTQNKHTKEGRKEGQREANVCFLLEYDVTPSCFPVEALVTSRHLVFHFVTDIMPIRCNDLLISRHEDGVQQEREEEQEECDGSLIVRAACLHSSFVCSASGFASSPSFFFPRYCVSTALIHQRHAQSEKVHCFVVLVVVGHRCCALDDTSGTGRSRRRVRVPLPNPQTRVLNANPSTARVFRRCHESDLIFAPSREEPDTIGIPPSCTALNLWDKHLNDRHAVALADALTHHQALEVLHLEVNG